MSDYQTYLKSCNCSGGGIIIYEGKAVCRWCRKPYGRGGIMNYEPEHFQSKELHKGSERIEVSHLWLHDNFKGNGSNAFWYQFCTSKPIEHITNSKIKQAIEKVLNGETNEKFWEQAQEFCDKEMAKYAGKKYTQSEVDTIREETWEAAREANGYQHSPDGVLRPIHNPKYQTLQDYLNSIKGIPERWKNVARGYDKPSPDTLREGKDWEIVEFRYDSNFGEYSIKKVGNKYVANMPSNKSLTSTTYPKNLLGECKIYSVKRLSDNEVFTIGDKIGWGVDGSYETTLTGFAIENGRLKFNDAKRREHLGWCDFLNAIKLHKKSPEILTNTVTDNSDVAILSLNDVMAEFGSKGNDHYESLYKKVNQKLKQ